MIYMDSAATSFLKPDCVPKAVADAFLLIGNAGRGAHDPTLNASRLLYQTREKLADFFHVGNPSNVAFTANVTQALNTVIHGCIHEGDHVITSLSEHNSVLRPLYRKEEEGATLSFLPLDEKGRVQVECVSDLIKTNTKAVVIGHGSNVTGNVVDLSLLSKRIKEKRDDILLIVDAAQTAGNMEIDMEKMGIDILCFTGHKSLFGPQGTGGICLRDGLQMESFLVGGSGVHSFDKKHPSMMPTALEAGTLNGHGIAGLKAALSYIEEVGVDKIHALEMERMQQFLDGIREIPDIILYGDYEAPLRTPIVSLNIGHMDAATVSDILWEDYEICVRAGAHCAPLIHEHFKTKEQGAVRFSFSCFNTEEEVATAIRAIKEIAMDLEG